MAELSVQVQNKLNVADKVIASARTHGPKVATILAERALAVQGPTTKVTVESVTEVIGAIADGVAHANTELRNSELNYFAEKADDTPVRIAREGSVTSVANILAQLRTNIDGTFGPAATAQYGLVGEIPRTPHKLVTYTNNVVKQLQDNPRQVTTAFGASFDTVPAAAAVQAKLAELMGIIKDDNREARELEEAQTARNRAVDAWANAYQGAASFLEGLFRTAGYAELADRVRPTQRKVRGEDPGTEIESPQTGNAEGS